MSDSPSELIVPPCSRTSTHSRFQTGSSVPLQTRERTPPYCPGVPRGPPRNICSGPVMRDAVVGGGMSGGASKGAGAASGGRGAGHGAWVSRESRQHVRGWWEHVRGWWGRRGRGRGGQRTFEVQHPLEPRHQALEREIPVAVARRFQHELRHVQLIGQLPHSLSFPPRRAH